jgi:hypothetical protein
VRRHEGLSGIEMLLWTTLGVGTGLVAAVALSEWIGDVNRLRMGRVAHRLRQPRRARLTSAASARAVEAALQAEPRLAGIRIEVLPVSRGVVELRGWVPTRPARTSAGRTALAVSGIESVINSILVRGEDDQSPALRPRATDQSA